MTDEPENPTGQEYEVDIIKPPLTNADLYLKTKTHCDYCEKAKLLLTKIGITYKEISIEDNRDECFERVRAATGADPTTAPQIFVEGKYIGGFDQLSAHYNVRLD